MANTSNRGFASMDRERQREIASKGGRAAHQKGTAHEFTSEEARQAGRKGGESRSANSTRSRLNAGNDESSGASNRSYNENDLSGRNSQSAGGAFGGNAITEPTN